MAVIILNPRSEKDRSTHTAMYWSDTVDLVVLQTQQRRIYMYGSVESHGLRVEKIH